MRAAWPTAVLVLVTVASVSVADEAPIAGLVKTIDTVAQTLTVETSARGKTRIVVIDVKPETKIIRFVRGTERNAGFKEQAAGLAEVKPGWTVSVATRHQGDREVAEVVRIVHER